MAEMPRGTVAFLFTDVENSSALWERNGDTMMSALARHVSLLREAVSAHGGVLFKTVGDGTQSAFPTAPAALSAALTAQRALLAEPWPDELGPLRACMALHAGEAEPRGGTTSPLRSTVFAAARHGAGGRSCCPRQWNNSRRTGCHREEVSRSSARCGCVTSSALNASSSSSIRTCRGISTFRLPPISEPGISRLR